MKIYERQGKREKYGCEKTKDTKRFRLKSNRKIKIKRDDEKGERERGQMKRDGLNIK